MSRTTAVKAASRIRIGMLKKESASGGMILSFQKHAGCRHYRRRRPRRALRRRSAQAVPRDRRPLDPRAEHRGPGRERSHRGDRRRAARGSPRCRWQGPSQGRSAALHFVAGGERRQDSVANAFAKTSKHADVVVIHDAARPFVTRRRDRPRDRRRARARRRDRRRSRARHRQAGRRRQCEGRD